jgi:hypothetical protein
VRSTREVKPDQFYSNGRSDEYFARGTGTKATCNTTQTCISASGGGRSIVLLGQPGPDARLAVFNWTVSLTVDSGNATPNGFGGECAPVGGTVALSPPGSPSDILVLDIQGSNCQVGADLTVTVITASQVNDPATSTGPFAGIPDGGSFNWVAYSSGARTSVYFNGANDQAPLKLK